MKVRFGKRVRVAKGVGVNFSTSGASLSLGGRRGGVNIGKNRKTVVVGIPGTNVYVGKTVTKTKPKTVHKKTTASRRSVKVNQSSPGVAVPAEVELHMDEKGKITILDGRGMEITNPSVLRVIKQSPQFNQQKEMLEQQRQIQIDEIVNESKINNERFIYISRLSPVVDSRADYEARLASIRPNEYTIPQFMLPYPTEASVREQLTAEAQQRVTGSLLSVGKLRKQYVEDNLHYRLAAAISDWEMKRNNFWNFQMQKKAEADAYFAQECNEQKEFMNLLINGDDQAVSEVFDEWISSFELPVEISVDYDWVPETGVMMLDVELPMIEDMPDTIMTKTDTGNLKEKKKTQAELKEEFSILVFGLAMFLSANAFNVSPAVMHVLISAYTKRRDKEGNLNEDYIYSIKFDRDKFEKKNMSMFDPKVFCMTTENRCNMTNTMLFKAITPYDSF